MGSSWTIVGAWWGPIILNPAGINPISKLSWDNIKMRTFFYIKVDNTFKRYIIVLEYFEVYKLTVFLITNISAVLVYCTLCNNSEIKKQ